jgi:two-component system, NarL family, nitrate/nitrite response regulator NarL
VPNIEILLRSRLVKDALSAALVAAGFSVVQEQLLDNHEAIVIIDFENCRDSEALGAHRQNNVKIVALARGADVVGLGPDEITPLSGILTYDLSVDAFLRSLQLISSGERVFPRDMALGRRAQAAPTGAEPRPDGDRLSPRERQILSHVVDGRSNKVIARHLGITEATVKVHLKSVLRKIRVENRTQAAIWALANLPELDRTPSGFV